MQNQLQASPSKLRGALGKVFGSVKASVRWTNKHIIVQCAIIAFVLNLAIEVLSRHSLVDALRFLVLNFIFFLLGMSIIFATLCVANFFRRRYAALMTVSLLWLTMGVTNFIIKLMRVTPFEANDLLILKGGFGIIFVYLDVWEIILISLLIVAVTAGLVLMYIKAKKYGVPWRKAITSFVSSALFVALLLISLSFTGAAPKNFTNLVDAYDRYGFIYCFGSSMLNKGVDKPDEYSQEYIDTILADIGSADIPSADGLPNIVFVQLESFVDVKYLKDIDFSKDPIPTFTALREDFTSGLLTVPSIGAGTANTEFEVMTGMRIHDFGPGEYPYKTILLKSTCESMAYNYKKCGYYAHAIHNNTATFYDRYLVFPNLGIDRYNSIEYMDNVEYNPVGWAKDEILIGAITGALDSTEQKDYVHAISVQGHGRYPNEKIDETQTIFITEESLEKYEQTYGKEYASLTEMEYFVNQLSEMDAFVSALVTELEKREEKTVVVFYGDHFPSLGIDSAQLDGCTPYQTEYVMWSNYDLPERDKDLTTYQLSAYVSGLLGINNGVVNRIHQKNFAAPFDEYLDYLAAVEYDMLYGEDYVNRGEELYEPTDMKMGLYDMTVSEIIYDAETQELTVKGSNFHENCVVFINGKRKTTEFISSSELFVNERLRDGDRVKVMMMSDMMVTKLSSTEEIVYNKKAEE